MNEAIETIDYKGFKIKIYLDTDVHESPRDWENLGTMVCFHKRYTLPCESKDVDCDDFDSWDSMRDYIIKELNAVVILPVFMYEHGGVTINTTGFSCRWDSGQIGFIYVDRETILKEYSCKYISKKIKEKVKKTLLSEIEIYDKYLRGEVYGFVIEDANGEHHDSCWGYYEKDYMISECKSHIDWYIKNPEFRLFETPEVKELANEAT